MKGFVQGADRQQTTLLPECLDDWVDESNPVRAVDVFVDAQELRELGFDGVTPAATGRPGYHPSPMLKLYIYGYLNRIQSSRRLEREAGRNLEVMWLTGRLVPDHKTIADFRKDNGPAIKKVCAQFIGLCRKMGLLAKASVAIDGSKFKAVNSRDNNFTKGKMERRLAQIEESVARYLSQLDTADRQTASGEAPSEELVARTTRLKEKLIKLEEEVKRLKAIEKVMLAAPDQQVSYTDPDSRSMATSGRGSGVVGYNLQAAVDTTNHLIVAHEVTNVGTDKSHLANMANQAKAALEAENLEAFADRGYFKGEEILACDEAGITVTLPKPQTSEAKSEGRFGKQDFRYVAEEDIYICPAGETLIHRFANEENGLVLHRYWSNACRTCALKNLVHEGPATPHHALGTRARCRCRAGASGQESGCDAYSPRDSRASVRHAEDADGGDALFDEDAAQSGDRDGAARARLQPYARDEHLRYQTVARSDPGLRRVLVRAVKPLRSLSTARGCARIDFELDTAKIGSAGLLEVHRARLLAVIGVRKTFPHGLDPEPT